jgi:predicted amidohydrolase
VQVLLFPELCLTGYTASDLFFSLSTLVAGAETALERLLPETASRRWSWWRARPWPTRGGSSTPRP